MDFKDRADAIPASDRSFPSMQSQTPILPLAPAAAGPEPLPRRLNVPSLHRGVARNLFEREREERQGHQRAGGLDHPKKRPAAFDDDCFGDY
jgi:hypothetical protein